MNTSTKYWKAIVNLLIAALGILLMIFVLPKVLIFFTPFLAGGIVALIASPLVKVLEKHFRLVRKAGSAFVIVLVLGLVALSIYLIGTKLLQEGAGFIRSLPKMYESMEHDFEEISVNLWQFYDRLPEALQNTIVIFSDSLKSLAGSLVEGIGASTFTAAAGSVAKNLPLIVINIIMAVLSSYLFVAQKNEIAVFLTYHMPEGIRRKWDIVWNSLKFAVGGYFKAQFKIMIVVFAILFIGFSMMKVQYAALIAFLTAVLDFLPFFGTGAVMMPWAVLKLLSGDYKMTLLLLIFWAVSQLVRQLIQPKLVGDSVGMRPIPTLVLLYIGFRFGGVLGMIIAVPLGMIIANLYQEGLFDATKKSIEILVEGINDFRRL